MFLLRVQKHGETVVLTLQLWVPGGQQQLFPTVRAVHVRKKMVIHFCQEGAAASPQSQGAQYS